MSRTVWTAATGLLMVLAGFGCGGASTKGISPRASAALTQQVDSIRVAVAGGSPAAAQDRLDQLRANVARLEAQGQLSASRADEILAAASEVSSLLASLASPATATAPPAPVASEPAARGDGHKKGKH